MTTFSSSGIVWVCMGKLFFTHFIALYGQFHVEVQYTSRGSQDWESALSNQPSSGGPLNCERGGGEHTCRPINCKQHGVHYDPRIENLPFSFGPEAQLVSYCPTVYNNNNNNKTHVLIHSFAVGKLYHHSMFHNPTAAVNLFHVGKQYLTFCKA